MTRAPAASTEPWRSLVASYWPADQVDNAIAIMKAESGMRANATNHNSNGTVDRGLWQINSVHSKRVNGQLDLLFDPEMNARIAHAIWSEQGWCPWATARKLMLCK